MILTIPIVDVEKRLGICLKRNYSSLGCDSASKAGWCLIETDNENFVLECNSLKIDSKDAMFKYQEIFKFFNNLIASRFKNKEDKIVVIEDTFFGQSVTTLKMLVRIGMTVFIACYLNNTKCIWVMPSSSRKGIKFPGNLRKEEFQKQFLKKIKVKQLLKCNNDEIDALVLAIFGLLEIEKKENIQVY